MYEQVEDISFMNPIQNRPTKPIHPISRDARELFSFLMVSAITSVVEYLVFAVGAFWLFVPFQGRSFTWWLISYSIEEGGLGTFYAFATSYVLAQLFNFVVQRKATFKATNRMGTSALMYAMMVIGIYVLQLLVPSFMLNPIITWVGYEAGSIIVKSLMMTMAAAIQYPLNKWVIMRKD